MVTACLTCGDKLLDEAFRFCDECAATVCETCGSRGLYKALVYCDNCEVYASHRYCLKEMPATPDEYVIWLCADCESKSLNSSKLAVPCVLSNGKSVSDEGELIQNSSKKRKGKKNKEKDVGSALAEPEPHEHSNCSYSQLTQKESDVGGCTTEILGNSDNPSRLEVVLISENREEDERIREPHGSNLELSCHLQARPIIEPIWRGTLSISRENVSASNKRVCLVGRGSLRISRENFGAIGRLVAHLSILACPQVTEAAKLLPELLCTELVSRSKVWPKGFERVGPSSDSIALYFFPEDGRYERPFDLLVDDMISGDLAMRTIVDNAELLVFSSNVLPLIFSRFQGKFYLWGVFRRKEVSSSSDDAKEKGPTKSLNLDTQSPYSPLSNCDSHNSNGRM